MVGRSLLALLLCALLTGAAWAATPDMVMKDVNGRQHRLSDYRGKWVVVNYWATWCPPCRAEIPELIYFNDEHKDKDAVVIGVDMETIDHRSLAQFIDDNLISYTVIPDSDDLETVGPVPGLPTTYVIDPNGVLAGQRIGGITTADLEAFIKQRAAYNSAAASATHAD